MMSVGTIREVARKAAQEAAARNRHPFIVTREDLEDWRAAVKARRGLKLPFPYLGDHRPEGWELEDTLFADATGFGEPDEPALTLEQLLDRLKQGMGYAIIWVGRLGFQVVLGEFARIVDDGTERRRRTIRALRRAEEDALGRARPPRKPNGEI